MKLLISATTVTCHYSQLAWQTVSVWDELALLLFSLQQIVHLDNNIVSAAEGTEAWEGRKVDNPMSATKSQKLTEVERHRKTPDPICTPHMCILIIISFLHVVECN